jgi:hypothetical protein
MFHFKVDLIVHDTADLHIKIYEDNVGALALGKLELQQRAPCLKHYAIKYHWFWEYISPQNIQLVKISYKDQLGDLFTKGLGGVKFSRLQKRLLGWDTHDCSFKGEYGKKARIPTLNLFPPKTYCDGQTFTQAFTKRLERLTKSHRTQRSYLLASQSWGVRTCASPTSFWWHFGIRTYASPTSLGWHYEVLRKPTGITFASFTMKHSSSTDPCRIFYSLLEQASKASS